MTEKIKLPVRQNQFELNNIMSDTESIAICKNSDIAELICTLLNQTVRVDVEKEANKYLKNPQSHNGGLLPDKLKKAFWISVDEKLPEEDEYVLCKLSDVFNNEIWMGKWKPDFERWYIHRKTNELYSVNGVTHWQPLPSLPEKPIV